MTSKILIVVQENPSKTFLSLTEPTREKKTNPKEEIQQMPVA
jgi:hypothetical protein